MNIDERYESGRRRLCATLSFLHIVFFFFLHFLRGLHLPIVEPHDHVLWSVNVWFCGSIVVEIQH